MMMDRILQDEGMIVFKSTVVKLFSVCFLYTLKNNWSSRAFVYAVEPIDIYYTKKENQGRHGNTHL